MSMAVLFSVKRRSTDTCPCFLGNTCLGIRRLTKVFTPSHRQVVRHWNCLWSNYTPCLPKKQDRQVFSQGLCRIAGGGSGKQKVKGSTRMRGEGATRNHNGRCRSSRLMARICQ